MRVTELNIYPLKSARGISLREMVFDDRGPVGDRRWMLVGEDNVMLSQRDLPRMTLIEVERPGENGASELVCSAPEMQALRVAAPASGRRIAARVWDDTVDVLEAGGPAHAWFTQYLGRACRLVFQPQDGFRQVDRHYAAAGVGVSLADGFPLLLIGQGSLDDLNRRLAQPIDMRRFRPNVVVGETEPFAEDSWRVIRIGGMEFDLVKRCIRCAIPSINPETAIVGNEPNRTLASFRRQGNDILFGQNAIHRGPGSIRVGDPVELLEK
jgi:uncharacterized protein YcbX